MIEAIVTAVVKITRSLRNVPQAGLVIKVDLKAKAALGVATPEPDALILAIILVFSNLFLDSNLNALFPGKHARQISNQTILNFHGNALVNVGEYNVLIKCFGVFLGFLAAVRKQSSRERQQETCFSSSIAATAAAFVFEGSSVVAGSSGFGSALRCVFEAGHGLGGCC